MAEYLASCTTCQSCNSCQSCNIWCQSCNGCQYCNSCEGCNTCEDCDSCQSCNVECNSDADCLTEQSFCSIGDEMYKDKLGSFTFSHGHTKDTHRMGPGEFDQAVWDEIIDYINEARSLGETSSSGGSILKSSAANVAPFKASEFNRIANTIGATTVNSGDKILGSYFTSLETAVSQYTFSSTACDKCNINCDVECNECQECNEENTDACDECQTCQGCNSCQSCNACQYCNRCQYCNTCQGTNTTCCDCVTGETETTT